MTTAPPIPFFDFKAVFAEDPDGFTSAFVTAAAAGQLILQPPVDKLETSLRGFIGCSHVVGLADCTNAMALGLRALGLRPGDEVILSTHTFVATAQAVRLAEGTSVPVDIGDDFMVAPESVEAAITPRTRVILATDVNGRTCAMDRLEDIARRRGVVLATDSAQALGAAFKGRRAGSFGAFGAFSFYPSKVFGGIGDGGALSTSDDALADRVRRMRNHGAGPDKQIPHDNAIWSTNARLDSVHAAILNQKFPRFPDMVARRRRIARAYHQALREMASLRLPPGPDDGGDHFDVYQNYELHSPARDALRAHLTADGIATIIQWGGQPIHQMRGLGFSQQLPAADAFFRGCFLLPMNHYLSDEQVLRICTSVRKFHGLGAWTQMPAGLPSDVPAQSPGGR